jgi:hypothetical protein
VLPEASPVVHGPILLAQLFLGHPLRDDAAPKKHLAEARALFFEKRDELKRKVQPEFLVEAADLERAYDAHRAVVLAAVAVRVAVRADAEHHLARRTVPGDEGAHGILVMLETQRLQFPDEVVQSLAVLGRVRVAHDGL